jgi:ubiquinone/menaquinone biosynthesis C-methylase UbiE
MEIQPIEVTSTIEASFHDKWAASMNPDELDIYAAFTAETTPEFHYALKALGNLEGKHLLDLGCGPGESSLFFTQSGARVTAIDISSGMIKVANELATRFSIDKDRLSFSVMSAEKLEFEDASFDLVFGSNVAHHCNVELFSREASRVLKRGGRAVFIDPLGYNPIINVYRRMAHGVRTTTEHPLVYKDIETIASHFSTITYKEFQLLTQAIFLWFYFGEHIHPNAERYWRKFVLESQRYAKAFRKLSAIDNLLLNKLPWIRRLCWVIVTVCDKQA